MTKVNAAVALMMIVKDPHCTLTELDGGGLLIPDSYTFKLVSRLTATRGTVLSAGS